MFSTKSFLRLLFGPLLQYLGNEVIEHLLGAIGIIASSKCCDAATHTHNAYFLRKARSI